MGLDGDGQREAVQPRLVGRWVTLRPLRPADTPLFYELMQDEAVGFRWRFRGMTPSPDGFSSAMWHGVTAQFVIEDKQRAPLGLVVLYNVDNRHGIAYVATMLRPDMVGRGWSLEGVRLFIDYVFTLWPLRKLYAETLEFNFTTISSWAGQVFEVEGRLKAHEYYDGRFWDLLVLSCTREAWSEYRSRVSARLGGR